MIAQVLDCRFYVTLTERLTNMITLPFPALALFVIVAFFLGIGVGATLKDPPQNSESKKTFPAEPREYSVTVTIRDGQLSRSSLLGENRDLVNFIGRRQSIIREFKTVPLIDLPITKPADQIRRLPLKLEGQTNIPLYLKNQFEDEEDRKIW
jgi:hypothetical protein